MSGSLTATEWAALSLAELLAKRRTVGNLFMDGSHNPLPTEYFAAGQFISSLVERGWTPPAEDS